MCLKIYFKKCRKSPKIKFEVKTNTQHKLNLKKIKKENKNEITPINIDHTTNSRSVGLLNVVFEIFKTKDQD